jgi:hypothetical protein
MIYINTIRVNPWLIKKYSHLTEKLRVSFF